MIEDAKKLLRRARDNATNVHVREDLDKALVLLESPQLRAPRKRRDVQEITACANYPRCQRSVDPDAVVCLSRTTGQLYCSLSCYRCRELGAAD